jgi:hypothetical protein
MAAQMLRFVQRYRELWPDNSSRCVSLSSEPLTHRTRLTMNRTRAEIDFALNKRLRLTLRKFSRAGSRRYGARLPVLVLRDLRCASIARGSRAG